MIKLSPIMFVAFIGAILFVLLAYLRQQPEGFVDAPPDGQVPTISQTSAVPEATAGATTADPTVGVAESKDLLAALDSIKTFKSNYEARDLSKTEMPQKIQDEMRVVYKRLLEAEAEFKNALSNPPINFTLKYVTLIRNQAEEQLHIIVNTSDVIIEVKPVMDAIAEFKQLVKQKDPMKTTLPVSIRNEIISMIPMLPQIWRRLESGSITQEEVNRLRSKFETMNYQLGRAEMATIIPPQIPEQPTPTTVAGPIGTITLKELVDLRKRIQDEIKRLSGLRSTSPTLLAKIQQLEKLGADLNDIITAVERKSMKLEDVPITPQDAAKFLQQLETTGNNSQPLAPLIVAKPATPTNLDSTGASIPPISPQIQDLLEKAKYLKFDLEVRIQYDPRLAMQDRMINAINNMEKNLTALAVSETPIPANVHATYSKELAMIKQALSATTPVAKGSPHQRLPTTYGREATLPNAEFPTASQLGGAQGARTGPQNRFPNGEISPDVFIRPGFAMNDESIAHRASASAFDDRVVTGPDYKQRALDLCRQIQGAQLGEPATFGCIKDPASVSSEYSWRGNYTMVCNRLGDTWGGWYPEMFGCPKYDPTAKFKGNMM